jgi:zinc/manganese transport system substrate-binding protein
MQRILVTLAMLLGLTVSASADPIKILAAENFYGDVAKQIGGDFVEVASVLSNPDQDPHLFEASPSVAKQVADAQIVIYSGLGYDGWMEHLISASPSTKRDIIVAADPATFKDGDNPHVWYDLNVMSRMASLLAEKLVALDAPHAADFQKNRAAFIASLDGISAKLSDVQKSHTGVSAAATEPVFGYVLAAMGLEVKEKSFQQAVMNDTEPSISDVARFEADLKGRKVPLLIYNSQATDPLADRMKDLADANKIPVVGVTETMPQGKTYQNWLLDEIAAVQSALGSGG